MSCKKPAHPINSQIKAACFLIKHHKCYSELSVGWSGLLLMGEGDVKIAVESFSEFPTVEAPSRPWYLSL